MKLYTVHELINESGDPMLRAERMAFVKDGIAWTAFLMPPLWALWHRMWLVFIGYILAVLVFQLLLISLGVSSTTSASVTLIANFLFALEANNLRRWTLERKGYKEVAAVSGRTREECELRFFVDWLEDDKGRKSIASRPPAPISVQEQQSAQSAVPTVGIVGRA